MTELQIQQRRIALLQQLRIHAVQHNLRLEDIAASTGWRSSTVAKMLDGKFNPSLDEVLTLCQALNIDINFTPKP